MKRVICGNTYNTDTSEQVASRSNGEFQSDFTYYRETLYRTRRGMFFVHGEGHAMSPYARQDKSGQIGWGESITPVSANEAATWGDAQ